MNKEIEEMAKIRIQRLNPEHVIKEINIRDKDIQVLVYMYGNKERTDEFLLVEAVTKRGKKVLRIAPDKNEY